jgi:UDP-glucose 4-epimerase
MAKHLILGGSGFLGRHVALVLSGRGDRVVVADRAPPPVEQSASGSDKLGFVEFDLASADWDRLIGDHDIIHHYAWSTIPQTANQDPIADLSTNVVSTLALLEALRRRGCGRLVFASSGGTVYGRLLTTPVPEEHPLEPTTAYGVSKLTVEKYLGLYRSLHGIDCRAARLANPFGVGQAPSRNQGAASVFLERALARETITIWGDGEIVRDYIHVSDAANGLAAVALATSAALGDSWTFNIGSGEGRSLNQVVTTISGLLNTELMVDRIAGRSFDVPVSILDVERARRYLGWQASLNFEAGMRLTINDRQAGRRFYSSPAV